MESSSDQWLYFTPLWRVVMNYSSYIVNVLSMQRNRFLLLMVSAFCFGASVGPFTKYFFEIERIVVRFLQGAAIVFGCFWFAARLYRERSQIYIGFLMETYALLRLWFGTTHEWMLKMNRFLLLIVSAFCFGASVGPFTKNFFEIDQRVVVRFLQGAAIVFECFWFAARIHRERSLIYIDFLMETYALLRLWFGITQWMLKEYVMLELFLGYLVPYSQKILYDARFGDIDFVNCTFTVFFCLPAIVVHAVRILFLGENIQATQTELMRDTLGTVNDERICL